MEDQTGLGGILNVAALDYLRQAGLNVEAVAGKLRVSPVELLTGEARQFITTNKAALLKELSAHLETKASTEPCRALPLVLTAATASTAWKQIRDQYINHLMTCGACHAPTRRYCAVGRSVRELYGDTSMCDHQPELKGYEKSNPRSSIRGDANG